MIRAFVRSTTATIAIRSWKKMPSVMSAVKIRSSETLDPSAVDQDQDGEENTVSKSMNTFKTPGGIELPLLILRGKPYLQVAQRLVWFRAEKPNWSIITSFVAITDKSAIARAEIQDEERRLVATSHKAEHYSNFPDFMEKAETGAIGRALALIGYGTQFCADELDEGERVVDAPIQRQGPSPEQRKEHGNRLGLATLPSVAPGQPGPEDGITEADVYKIPFGQWKQRTLDEVMRNFGPEKLRRYIEYLEASWSKTGGPMRPEVTEFIERAADVLGAFENAAV